MAGEIAEDISKTGGLCTGRFHADIVTCGVDYAELREGDIIEAGGRRVRITRVGKPCFPECPVENKPCVLQRSVAFGEPAED